MKKILLSSLVISSFCFAFAKDLTLEEVSKIGVETSESLNSILKQKLKDAKRETDMKGMMKFCIKDSMKTIEEFNKTLASNISIKRVSLNSRNDKSKAEDDEKKILEAFELIQKSDAYLPEKVVQISSDDLYKVYVPIQMKSRECKKCHGLENKVDDESKKRFFEVYKNKNGLGYKSGDVRGAYVVNISKK